MRKSSERMLLAYIAKLGNCWLWTGELQEGLPVIHEGIKTVSAARVAWWVFRGRLPRSKHIYKMCASDLCINPTCHTLDPPLTHRLWSHIEITEGCWLWRGPSKSRRRPWPNLSYRYRNYSPRRLVWEQLRPDEPMPSYTRWACGDPMCVSPYCVKIEPTFDEALWAHIDKTDTCWLWTGPCLGARPVFTYKDQHFSPHRVLWERSNGPTSSHLTLQKTCINDLCINPRCRAVDRTLEDCFNRLVMKTESCWIWAGPKKGEEDGRPILIHRGREHSASRVAWVLSKGALNDDARLFNICGHSDCVNPDCHVNNSSLQSLVDGYVLKSGLCWIWRGPFQKQGSSRKPILQHDGVTYMARRLVLQLSGRELSKSECLHNLCGDDRCVSPDCTTANHTPDTALWFFIAKTPGCWLWTRPIPKDLGQPRFAFKGKQHLVRRRVWEQLVGPIPPNKQLLNTCSKAACVKPECQILR